MSRQPRTQAFPFNLDVSARRVRRTPHKGGKPEITCQDLTKALDITPEQSRDISCIPQGTPEWLAVRKNRLTASNFGAAIGMNQYSSPTQLLKNLLWNTFKGNAATRWGSEHEKVALDAYLAHMRAQIAMGTSPYTSIEVEETGLYINPDHAWLGSSPDGVVHVTTKDGDKHKFLLEIKCPYKKSFYSPCVPPHYNCQIQGMMANMKLPYCDFVVWIPGDMQINRVDFDPEFWDTTLFPGLKTFYWDRYLPALVAKANGQLEEGDTEITWDL